MTLCPLLPLRQSPPSFRVRMAVSVPGVVAMVFFYILVLGVGIWASFKARKEEKKNTEDRIEMALLANRSINWVVGIFTMSGEFAASGACFPRHFKSKLQGHQV